jgi:hypothetical protein
MMARMKRKMSRRVVYHGFGFPVTLVNVPMVLVRGAWTPDVNYEQIQRALLRALSERPSRLTGAEVRFIRLTFELTLQKFAKRFGVTHPAVLKWEKAGRRPTGMGWATEKDIRLYIISRLEKKPGRFYETYLELEHQPTGRPGPLALDLTSVA